MLQELQTSTLTQTYNFKQLQIGDYIVVYERFQHARVAASEYGRKHNVVFTCRMQPDRTMHITRVERDQVNVDRRGRQGKRVIPAKVVLPTKDQFFEWLHTLAVGEVQTLGIDYSGMYPVFQAWCELYSLRTGRMVNTIVDEGVLLITYII